MFVRAGAYALASRKRRMEELSNEFNNSDDENYVQPEKRNYLCIISVVKCFIFSRSPLVKNEKNEERKIEYLVIRKLSLWIMVRQLFNINCGILYVVSYDFGKILWTFIWSLYQAKIWSLYNNCWRNWSRICVLTSRKD